MEDKEEEETRIELVDLHRLRELNKTVRGHDGQMNVGARATIIKILENNVGELVDLAEMGIEVRDAKESIGKILKKLMRKFLPRKK